MGFAKYAEDNFEIMEERRVNMSYRMSPYASYITTSTLKRKSDQKGGNIQIERRGAYGRLER